MSGPSGGQATNAARQERWSQALAAKGKRRIPIVLPALLVLDIEREAAERGISRSDLVAEALAARKLHTAS